jgi:hypothetical protein
LSRTCCRSPTSNSVRYRVSRDRGHRGNNAVAPTVARTMASPPGDAFRNTREIALPEMTGDANWGTGEGGATPCPEWESLPLACAVQRSHTGVQRELSCP